MRAEAVCASRRRWPRNWRLATASPVNGVCLTVVTTEDGAVRVRRRAGNGARDHARGSSARMPGQSRAAAARGRTVRRTLRAGPRRRDRSHRRVAAEREFHWLTVSYPALLAPLCSCTRARWRVDGISLTVAGLRTDLFRGAARCRIRWSIRTWPGRTVHDSVNLGVRHRSASTWRAPRGWRA